MYDKRKYSICVTSVLKSSHACHLSYSLYLLLRVEQTGNVFHFVLLQSESSIIFLITQLAGEELSCMKLIQFLVTELQKKYMNKTLL